MGIYCAHEAIADAGVDWENTDKSRVGVYIGVTEHGNVETENEIFQIKGYDYDTSTGRIITTPVRWPTTRRARSR